jgi:hypothetical protein
MITSWVVRCRSSRSAQHGFVVQHVVVAYAPEAALTQGGCDGIGVRAAHLELGDGFARLDQFVAGGHDHDGGLAADANAGHPGRGGDRDFGRAQERTGLEQQSALAAVGAAPVHVVIRRRGDARLQ